MTTVTKPISLAKTVRRWLAAERSTGLLLRLSGGLEWWPEGTHAHQVAMKHRSALCWPRIGSRHHGRLGTMGPGATTANTVTGHGIGEIVIQSPRIRGRSLHGILVTATEIMFVGE